MAVLMEEIDSETDVDGASQPELSLEQLLKNVQIPADYTRYETLDDLETLNKLLAWKAQALGWLKSLRIELQRKNELTEEETAQVVCAVAPFLSKHKWSSTDVSTIAQEILNTLNVDIPLLETIFSSHIKPIFQSSTHPMLSAQSGRALSRPLGGTMGAHDMYEGQVWKSHLGIDEAITWCLERIPSEAYDRLWYLVVPPIMTLLDDYEMRYKISATRHVQICIRIAPPELLCRTGIADLFFTSLKRALTLLHSPETPALLRAAGSTAIELVLCTSPVGSEERFTRLCELLGDAIIGSVWVYAHRDSSTIEASVDVVPALVDALGIGSSRYLKALVPQLTHPLHPNPDLPPHPSLQLASLRGLQAVVRACAPRMYRWKGTVLEGVAKCWVTLTDSGREDETANRLREALKAVCVELEKAVPSVREDYERLLKLDAKMFTPLFDACLP